jgi:hypothetical protein
MHANVANSPMCLATLIVATHGVLIVAQHAATQDAVGDLEYALENLPQQELVTALGILFEPTSEQGEFAFDFEVTTTSLKQEFIEFVALNALNDAIDFGEADDVPLDTGFPMSGVSEYQLTFNVVTRDLDFASV